MSSFKTAADLKDVFRESDYPRDASGLTQVPAEDIYNALRDLFPHGYKETLAASGHTPDGRPYVIITLEVRNEDGTFTQTVVGAAEPEPGKTVSFSGLLTMARRNAVLRGLGMGHSLYNSVAAHEEAVKEAPAVHQVHSTATRATTTGTYVDRSGKVREEKPWTEEMARKLHPKTGTWAATCYADIPLETLEKWANFSDPHPIAVKEIARRRAAAGLVKDVVERAIDEHLDNALETTPAAATVAGSRFSFNR